MAKFIIVAGTPGSGKTSVLIHTIKELRLRKLTTTVVKIDCLQTDDKRRYEKEEIPVRIGLSNDMCPDHFAIYNTDSILEQSKDNNILIEETAGLCLRCSPYTDKCLAVCVIDITNGPNTPLKIGPLLTTADIVITTKGDLVSQAEREVFRERIYEINPDCSLIEANGLSGKGSAELADIIEKLHDKPLKDMKNMVLRHTPPLAVCTLCTGERRTNKELHFGVLRNLEGNQMYEGE